MILTTADVNVIVMDFPDKKGHEMVVPNEDGSYTPEIHEIYYGN